MSYILNEDMGLRSLPTPVTRKKCALSPVIIGMFAVVVSFPDYVLCLIFGSSLAVYHVSRKYFMYVVPVINPGPLTCKAPALSLSYILGLKNISLCCFLFIAVVTLW